MHKPEIRIVLTTAPSETVAKSIAHALVERGLAACVNILPGLSSVYRWEGKICDQPELLLIIKTSSEALTPLAAAFRDLHPYDTPEFLVLDPTFVAHKYAQWVLDQTKVT